MAAPNTPRRPAPARAPATRPLRRRSPVGAAFWLLCALTLAAGVALQAWFPGGFVLGDGGGAGRSVSAVSEIHASSSVQLSEVMTSNDGAVSSDTGMDSDWVEIVNTGAAEVDLSGYALISNDAPLAPFMFPDTTLSPGEYLLIYCDGLDRRTQGYALHATFRLDADGAGLSLFDASSALVDSVEIPALEQNHVYRRNQQTGDWELSGDYTPGLSNTLENHLGFDVETVESPLVISEISAANRTYAPAASGECYDYIEIYNASAEAVDLSGYFLTDDEDDLYKWSVPEGTVISGGGYLLVYASGGAQGAQGELHASFKLSSEGEPVILSDPEGRAVCGMDSPELAGDQAYSLTEDGAYTTALAPTPGMANTTHRAAALSAPPSRKFALYAAPAPIVASIAAFSA